MPKTSTASQRQSEHKPTEIAVPFCKAGDEADPLADLVAPRVLGVGAALAVRNLICGELP